MQKGEGLAKDYPVAKPGDYDAIIILGGHSGDIMQPDDVALKFIKAVVDRGVPVAAIGGGILPLIHLKVVNGKKVTGNLVVDFMLRKVADYRNESVVTGRQADHWQRYRRLTRCPEGIVQDYGPEFVDKQQRYPQGEEGYGHGGGRF